MTRKTFILVPVLLAALGGGAFSQQKLTLSQLSVELPAQTRRLPSGYAQRPVSCRATVSNDDKVPAANLTLIVTLQNGAGEEMHSWEQKVETLEPGKNYSFVSPIYYDTSLGMLQMKASVRSGLGKIVVEKSWSVPPVGEKPNGY